MLAHAVASRGTAPIDLSNVPDPSALFDLARRFAILPRLVFRLDLATVPEAFRADVEHWRTDYAERASARAAEAFVLSTLLRAEQIEHVFLKGAGLAAHGASVTPGDRHTDDVDLLVPANQRDEIMPIIEGLGYVLDLDSALPAVGGGTIADQEFTTSTHSELGMVSPRGVRLDLHWYVPDAAVSGFDDVMRHTVPAGPDGGQIPVPIPALLLAQVCDHIVVHHRARPAYLPRHIGDLVDLDATFGPAVWRDAEALGDKRALRASKWLLDRTLSGRLSPQLLFPPGILQTGLEAAAELVDVMGRVRRDLRADPRRVIRKVVPTREFVASSYGIAPDDPRIPLCYLHRLITLRFLFKPLRG